MTKTTQAIVLSALQQYLGDDHIRAAMAFKGLNAEQMKQDHEQSGESRQSLLDGYIDHANKVKIAIEEIKNI